jgi:hypothetical protein
MVETAPPEGYLFTKGYTSYISILLWLLYFFDYVDRMVVVSLFPFLKRDWGLTDAQCGALVSAVYWAIILFYLGSRFYKRDRDKVERVALTAEK